MRNFKTSKMSVSVSRSVINMNNIQKKRGARCTNEQLSVIINYIDEHKTMVLGKLSPQEMIAVDGYWKDLTQLLNTTRGASKSMEQWKRTFIEYKSKVRAKARGLKIDQQGTGGGKGKNNELNDIENKLMGMLGWVSCDGDPMLPEPGLPVENRPIDDNVEAQSRDQNNDIIYAEISETGSVVLVDTNEEMEVADKISMEGTDKISIEGIDKISMTGTKPRSIRHKPKRVGGLRNVAVTIPTAVSPGDTVTLKCQYDLENDPLYTVKWYKGRQEFFRFIPKELPHTRVFPLPGINVDVSKSGANEVVLRDVQFHMAGKYRCEVSADAPSFHTSMVASYMHVVYLPEGQPKMMMEKQRYAVGDILRGNCTSPPSNPPTNLTWYVNDKKMNESFLQRYSIDISSESPNPEPLPSVDGNIISSSSSNTNINNGGSLTATEDTGLEGMQVNLEENYKRMVTVVGLELEIEGGLFQYGKVRIECKATMFQLYSSTVELVIDEERPRLASVLGTRESSLGASSRWSSQYIWIMTLCLLATVASR